MRKIALAVALLAPAACGDVDPPADPPSVACFSSRDVGRQACASDGGAVIACNENCGTLKVMVYPCLAGARCGSCFGGHVRCCRSN